MSVFRKAAVAMALFAPLAGCLGGAELCGNNIVSSIGAPGGAYGAMLFQRDCGATTGFTTQISILRRGEKEAGKGNVFIADDDHGAAPAGAWGGPWAEIRWVGPDRLLVRYPAKARIFLKRKAVSGVRILYQPVAAEPPRKDIARAQVP